MASQPVRHSRVADWLAGHLGYPDLFKTNAELRRTIEDLRGHLGMADALVESQRTLLQQKDAEMAGWQAEMVRLADRLEDCNRRLANLSENGSERMASDG